MAVGLYAGKRRAVGSCWSDIARELTNGLIAILKAGLEKVSWPFRKDGKKSEISDSKPQ